MREIDLVPSLLVFKIITRFTIFGTELSNQNELMEAITSAHANINFIIAELHVKDALTKTFRPATVGPPNREKKSWYTLNKDYYEIALS